MKIIGHQESSIDYSGKIAAVVFTPGCNFKCPACHSKQVIESENYFPQQEIFSYLNARKQWIDGVVICGGEPTLQKDLPDFIRKLKQLKQQDLAVKLDTNGSNPQALERAIESGVDYVAMDVKAPPRYYNRVVGADSHHLRFNLGDIETSMRILTQTKQEKEKNFNYEFRTTIVPIIRNNNPLSWITTEEAEEIARWINNITGTQEHKYFLQQFVARTKEEMIDERFSEENLPQEMHETPSELMQKLKEAVLPFLPSCEIR